MNTNLSKEKGSRSPSNLFINISNVAFWFWFYLGISPALTYLLFRSMPTVAGPVTAVVTGIFAFLLGLGGVFGNRQEFRRIISVLPVKLVVLYSVWAGITVLWTGAPKPIAFVYWLILALQQYTVVRVLSCNSREEASFSCLKGFTLGSFFFALVPLIAQETDNEGRLGNEEFLHPNTIGHQLALAGLSSIYLILQSKGGLRQRLPYILILVVQLFTLLRSLSKTSIFCFLLASTVYIIRSKISLKKKLLITTVAGGIVALSSTMLLGYLDRYLNEQQGGEALTTATGRSSIWEMTWDYIQQNSILGYGFQSYRYTAPQIIGVRLVHAHNDVLNIWYTLGGIGLSLAILTYLSYTFCWIRAAKRRSPQEALGLALLLYSLIRGLTEATVDDLMTYSTPLMLLIAQWMALSKPTSMKNTS
ncbi:O-antigen ligase family protein [Leptolyngbya ohadii]|uniref:O-antigen ligase family protein n=1 Tax=Leptolyngbya ohadii TaxID=1962290 RepID=UPI0015C5CD6A|nr:O-antigen ligase family protein [Leptolyngbya ohadii]